MTLWVWFSISPASTIEPPSFNRVLNSGANSMSGFARMFAVMVSAVRSCARWYSLNSSGKKTFRRSDTLFRAAFWCVARMACGSISTANTSLRPVVMLPRPARLNHSHSQWRLCLLDFALTASLDIGESWRDSPYQRQDLDLESDSSR